VVGEGRGSLERSPNNDGGWVKVLIGEGRRATTRRQRLWGGVGLT
jgi:hypothetical protein